MVLLENMALSLVSKKMRIAVIRVLLLLMGLSLVILMLIVLCSRLEKCILMSTQRRLLVAIRNMAEQTLGVRFLPSNWINIDYRKKMMKMALAMPIMQTFLTIFQKTTKKNRTDCQI